MAVFEGTSAFPITPANPDGSVDTEALGRLLGRLKEAKVQSVGLLGSTGTYAYLSRSERKRATEAAVACKDNDIPLIVGVGAMRTDDAVVLAQDAEQSGADALLLAPVSYTPLTEEEVYQHYRSVAEATSLPLCIYNNPGTTHFTFTLALLQRLADLPTISAIKMPLPIDGTLAAHLHTLRKALPEDFLIGYSGDWGCADALLAGADTWYSVIGGTLPVPVMKLAQAAQAGNVSETRKIDELFQPLWTLFKELGSLRVVYAIANLLSLTEAQPPRPILPVSDRDRGRVAQALERLDPIS